MKKLYLIILLLLVLVKLSYSQNGWFLQNSGVNTRITDIFFIDDQIGWMVSDSSKVLKTTNGGTTWTQQAIQGYTPLNSIYFMNANTGWAGGGYYHFFQSGTIYKTTNGGSTWLILSHIGNLQDLYFSNELNGFVGLDQSGDFVSGGSVLKTSNGGINWNGISSGYIIRSLSFINSNTGYALGYYWDDTGHDTSIVYRTINGGSSWDVKYKRANRPIFYFSFSKIFAYTNKIWITGRDSFIVYSSNSGLTWGNQIIPDYKTKNSIFFIDENTGWAVGNNFYDTANIIKTTNGGAAWFKLKNLYNNPLWTVFFINQNTGWAAGDNGIILKTVTGGLTSVSNQVSSIVKDYFLHQNYPNPFNPQTTIFYDLNSAGYVKLKVYDIYGRELKTLVNKEQNVGNYKIEFNAESAGGGLASGIYIYKLEVNDVLVDAKKMVLIR